MRSVGLTRLCALLVLVSPALAKKAAREPVPPRLDLESLENVCDLITQVQSMYCYCDHLDRGDGTTANCLIYNSTRPQDLIWDTFFHQPNLNRLALSVRRNGSMDYIPARALTYTRHLYVVDINNAAIDTMAPNAFGRSPSIADIELSGNGIEVLERHAFRGLRNLTKLNLGENKIATVNRHVFVELPRLQKLYLDRNRLVRIKKGAFAELGSLRVLELYGNSLKQVSHGTFKGLRRLQRLDLHRNQLTNIGDGSFSELAQLRVLDLSENQIHQVGELGLRGVPRLMNLILHHNRLRQIAPGTLHHTPELFYLSLQHNRLRSLDERTFAPIRENMRNITMYFYMADNELQCDCRLRWLQRLRDRTASAHVRAALDAANCQLPDADQQVKVMEVKMSEVPCDLPLAEQPASKQNDEQRAPVIEQQKLRALSSPQKARGQVTAPAPISERADEVSAAGVAAGVTDRGSGALARAPQLSGVLLMLLLLVAR